MLRRSVAVALAVVVVGAPGAVAHEGNPNYLSRIDRITPATAGVSVEVLNRDDRLLLRNTSGKEVVVEGYDGEPCSRAAARRSAPSSHSPASPSPVASPWP